jgi:hypothetical protein
MSGTMTDDLVERVAEEMWQAQSMRAVGTRRTVPWSEAGEVAHMQWRPIAKAAIAIALEEAAKTADRIGETYFVQDGTRLVAEECASAIRGMVKD